MAQSAMAGSGPNAQAHGKAGTNSAVKAQQSQNAAGNGAGAPPALPKNSAPLDVGSVAPPAINGAAVVSNGNGAPAANGPGENATLQHDSGLALDWTADEQSILEDALNKHASQTNSLVKYIRIAALLSDKTVRDVALRVRWMTKKENGKRRKDEAQNTTKKAKDKKDKAETTSKQMPASNLVPRSPMPMYSPPPPIDNDDGISNESIGGTTGQLLEQNVQVIAQIRSNLAAMKMQENTDLLVRFRDNIFCNFERDDEHARDNESDAAIAGEVEHGSGGQHTAQVAGVDAAAAPDIGMIISSGAAFCHLPPGYSSVHYLFG